MDADADVVVVRGRPYERTPAPSPAPHQPRPVPAGRWWAPSVIAFGLPGRCVCTLLVLLPGWRFLATGSLFWLLYSLGSLPLGAWILRETWRRYSR